MLSHLYQFLKSEDGPTAVEYSIMLALIAGVVLASVAYVGSLTADSFNYSKSEIERTFPDMGG